MRTKGKSARSISPENALFHVLVGVGVGEDELTEFGWEAEERVGLEESGTGGFGFGALGATRFGVKCGLSDGILGEFCLGSGLCLGDGLWLWSGLWLGGCHGLCVRKSCWALWT